MKLKIKTTAELLGLEMNQSRFLGVDDILPWFEAEYKIHELVNDFWGLDTKSRLIAVSKDIKDQAWKGLVSEWDTDSQLQGQFRLNKDLIASLLKSSLGQSDEAVFSLKNLTKLEFAFFENFFVSLENYWKDYWRLAGPQNRGTYLYLIWVIELENKEIGSIAIGVPPGIGPSSLKTKNTYDFREIASGLNISVPIDLTVGKSKLKISEIKGLEKDDLIVFENSNTGYFVWYKNEIDSLEINLDLPAKDNPNYAELYYDDLELDDITEESDMNDDLLTDLPVELTAQFKSVHMPLQKIIELESGGILPLGLLMDSQITLMAPGDKPIASGNLVVVGNQFGIKINKTNIKKPASTSLSTESFSQQNPAPSPQQHEHYAPDPANHEAIAQATDFARMADAEDLGVNDANLDQELEDIGIDPKELDELEDLY